jgi:hypothetical protein
MPSVKCTITSGDVGPSLLADRYGFRPFQRRDYADGLTMIIEYREVVQTVAQESMFLPGDDRLNQVVGTMFIRADGLNGGWHRRIINSPSDVGALLTIFRRGLVQLGIYPLFDDAGHRRMVGYQHLSAPYRTADNFWHPTKPGANRSRV